MQRIRKSESSKNILLLLFAIFICFITFEIGVRFLWEEPGYGYPAGLHISDDTKGYKYKPNFVGNFPLQKNIEVKINSEGLRDYEHAYDKPEEKIRILGLGDSITFGSGVAYEDTYLRQLEKKFSENGQDIEIIKAGVNGYEFDQEYMYYFEEGHKYFPDIVLIGIALNDARIVNPEIEKQKLLNEIESNSFRKFIGKNFKAIKFAYLTLENIWGRKDYNEKYFERIYALWEGESFENYKKKLLGLNKNLTENNVKLVLIIFPYTQQFKNSENYGRMPQEEITNLSSSSNISVIDLTQYLDLPNYADYYLEADNAHLNGKGYNLVKDVIYSKLIEESIVKNAK